MKYQSYQKSRKIDALKQIISIHHSPTGINIWNSNNDLNSPLLAVELKFPVLVIVVGYFYQ